MAGTGTEMSWGSLLRGVGTWLRRNLPRAVVMSAAAFAFSYAVNFVVMAFRWDGFRAPGGSAQMITAENSLLAGSLFWAAASSFTFALFAYGRRVGWSQLRAELLGFPAQVSTALQGEERARTLATLAWGIALSLLLGTVITPAVAGVTAAFVVVFASSPFAQMLSGVVRRLWMTTVYRLAPEGSSPGTSVGGAVATAAGTAAGLGAAVLVEGTFLKLLLAGGAGYLAYRFASNEPTPVGGTAVIVLLAAGVGLSEWLQLGVAFADDGGWSEYCLGRTDCSMLDYVRSTGATEVVSRSTVGATAAGVGAPVGSALGDLLAGGSDGGGDDPGDGGGGDGPDSGADHPGGPARTTTVTLTGQAARDALQAQLGDEIAIPEDEQWSVSASSDDRRITEGHLGERGRITGFGPVVTGPDGEIVLTVDVETDGPTREDVDERLGESATPPRPTMPPPVAPTPPPVAEAPSPEPATPPSEPHAPQGTGAAEPPPRPTTPPPVIPPLPASPPPVTPPAAAAPSEPVPAPDPVSGPEPGPSEEPGESGDTSPATAGASPDVNELADAVQNGLQEQGLFDPSTREEVGDFVRGDRSDLDILPPTGTPLDTPVGTVTLGEASATDDGRVRVGVEGPGGVPVHVDVGVDEDGNVTVEAGGSVPGTGLALGSTVDAMAQRLNDTLEATGRRVDGITVDEDGRIHVETSPIAQGAEAADAATAARIPDDEIVFDDGTTRAERLEQLARNEARSDAANSWWGWARATTAETLAGISEELVTELPGQVIAAGEAGLEMAGTAFDAVTDPNNIQMVLEGSAETVYDAGRMLLPPGLADTSDIDADLRAGLEASVDAVETAAEVGGTIAGTLYAAAEQDPAGAAVTVVETVLGRENWEQAMDPETPVLERMGRAVWGAVDNVATIGGLGSGALSAIDKTGDMLRGARAVDAAAEGARGVGVLDDLAAASARGVDASTDGARASSLADDAAALADDVARTADDVPAGTVGRAADDLPPGTVARAADDLPPGTVARAADDVPPGTVARTADDVPPSAADDVLAASDDVAPTPAAAPEATPDLTDLSEPGPAARAARAADDGVPLTPDELATRRGGPAAGQAPGEASVPGGPGRVGGPNREVAGIPQMETGADYVRALPEGAIIDANRITDTGYTGAQLHGRGPMIKDVAHDGTEFMRRSEMGMRDLARKHGVSIETRTTNFDSMRHIRDGNAVPKPLDIKSKTIQDIDTYLGARKGDEGLVGFFEPRRPNAQLADFDGPEGKELYARVMERYEQRAEQYGELRAKMEKLEKNGTAIWDRKRGIMLDAKTGKPYAGDIDPVIFRDAVTGEPVPRWRYEEIVRDFADPRNAIGGQHGAEYEVIRDLTRGKQPGTPEFQRAVAQSYELHQSLSRAQHGEVTVRMGVDGVLTRSQHYGGRLPMATNPAIDSTLGL